MASHRASGGAALARRRQLSCHGSGVTPSALTPDQPPQRRPSPSWIYPKPIDSDTSCCSLTPSAAWIGPRTATVRTSAPPDPLRDLWEDQLAGAHRTSEESATRLAGPSPAATRESSCARPHPRCLPPLGPLCWPAAVFPPLPTSTAREVSLATSLEVGHLPGSVSPHRLGGPDTFVTAGNMALTGSMRRRLSRTV
jgi:hypothetical protein